MTIEQTSVGTPENFTFDPEVMAFIEKDYAEKVEAAQTNLPSAKIVERSPRQKIEHVLNNFWFRLPGGWSRTLGTDDDKEMQDMFKQIDIAMTELGLSNMGTTAQDYADPAKLNDLAILYVALRKKGIPRKILTI